MDFEIAALVVEVGGCMGDFLPALKPIHCWGDQHFLAGCNVVDLLLLCKSANAGRFVRSMEAKKNTKATPSSSRDSPATVKSCATAILQFF
jgi:hypothetical protein